MSHTLLITDIQVVDLPNARDEKPRTALVQIKPDSVWFSTSTEESKNTGANVSWKQKIQFDDLPIAMNMTITVLRHHHLLVDENICEAKVTVYTFVRGTSPLHLSLDTGRPDRPAALTVYYVSDPETLADNLVAVANVGPSSDVQLSRTVKRLLSLPIPDHKRERRFQGVRRYPHRCCGAALPTITPFSEFILESIEPFHRLFTEIAKIHPFASAAWPLLNTVYNVLQIEHEKSRLVKELYEEMVRTYGIASDILVGEEEDVL